MQGTKKRSNNQYNQSSSNVSNLTSNASSTTTTTTTTASKQNADNILDKVSRCMNRLIEIASQLNRNIILDQVINSSYFYF